MKKTGKIIYIVLVMIICLIPFAGMLFRPTNETTEKKELAKLPKVTVDGKLNKDYFDELSAYFEDHFAFRPELVSADAEIQTKIFKVSNVDTVVAGKNGWLYYKATVNDYKGITLSDRAIFNIARNVRLVQDYVTAEGKTFLFTVPANKNSLYGENMPGYIKTVKDTTNLDKLVPVLDEQGVKFANLKAAFEATDEVLYLKRDSHWNETGAVLAYNTILDKANVEHNTYETATVLRKKDYLGDLNLMVYPKTAKAEWNTAYDGVSFTYVEGSDVEDALVVTAGNDKKGSLLMFRDSFGNTLLPLMASNFEQGVFSKVIPQNVGKYVSEYEPELVIIEKVERNLIELVTKPPIMPGNELVEADGLTKVEGVDVKATVCEEDGDYWKVSGVLDDSACSTNTEIFAKVSVEGKEAYYSCYGVSTETSDNGFILYLSNRDWPTGDFKVEVFVK